MTDVALPTTLPDPTDAHAVASYVLVHDAKLAAIRSWLAVSSRTLGAAVRDGKIIHTEYGDYGEIPDVGWDYSAAEIADTFPEYGFAEQRVSFTVDSADDAAMIHDIVLETVTREMGERFRRDFKVVTDLDRKAVSEFIKVSQNDEVVAKLKTMRKRSMTKGKIA